MATYQQLIDRARLTLNDAAKDRYPDAEMFAYALDGLREAATFRPDLFSVVVPMSLQAGVEQIIPPGAWFLISVERNSNGDEVLEASYDAWHKYSTDWRTHTAGPTEFWMRFPSSKTHQPITKFYVYPPAIDNAQLYVVVGQCDLSAQVIGGAVPLPEPYQPALIAYMIFRAETKDDQHVVTARAQTFYEKFVVLLGAALKAEKTA
jgi:hypothetical protein